MFIIFNTQIMFHTKFVCIRMLQIHTIFHASNSDIRPEAKYIFCAVAVLLFRVIQHAHIVNILSRHDDIIVGKNLKGVDMSWSLVEWCSHQFS
jgi:hypothetical protein